MAVVVTGLVVVVAALAVQSAAVSESYQRCRIKRHEDREFHAAWLAEFSKFDLFWTEGMTESSREL